MRLSADTTHGDNPQIKGSRQPGKVYIHVPGELYITVPHLDRIEALNSS